MKKLVLFFLLSSSIHIAHAQLTAKTYQDPQISLIIKDHEKIAILPMDVTVKDVKSSKKNRLTDDEVVAMEQQYQETFQNSMYSWFLKMKQRGRLRQDIQDVHRTNLILRKNGIETVDDLSNYTFEEVATMLEVDGIFAGNVVTTRSLSQGGAFAIAALTGISVKTGDADVFVKLYDGKEGKLIWSFDRTVSSSYAGTPEDVVDYLMKRVSKRFPYKQ